MKLVRKTLERDGSGTLVLLPQDSEDMWYIYNMVQEGDELEAVTMRKLLATADASSKKATPRVRLRLRIRVEKIEFDVQGNILRLNGPTISDAKDVPLGSYHTMKLEPQHSFELFKETWDSFALQTVEDATNIENRSDIAAVVLQPGLAHVCLVTEAMTVMRAKVEVTIPRKRRGDNSQQQKAMERFLGQVAAAIPQSINLEKIKVVLLAAPGMLAQDLYQFIFKQAVSTGDQTVVKAKAKFVVGHASSGHLHALSEALADPAVASQLTNTRYGREMAVLDRFFKSLNDDDNRAWYGPQEVEHAINKDAVETLLLTDTLFRSSDLAERKRYVAMADQVRDAGREVLVLSSLHPSGEQLDSVSGVACLLLYPMDYLDEEIDEEEQE